MRDFILDDRCIERAHDKASDHVHIAAAGQPTSRRVGMLAALVIATGALVAAVACVTMRSNTRSLKRET